MNQHQAPRPAAARVLPFALLLLAGASCSRSRTAESKPPFTASSDSVQLAGDAPAPMKFDTEEAKVGPALAPAPVTARVASVEALTAPAFAPLEGRIAEVRVHLGDHVEKGDKLLQIRTADLAQLQHDLRAAQLAVKTRDAIVERTRKMVDARAASQNDLLVAQSELDESRLAERSAAARIQSLSVAQSSDNTYWVVAARSGTVIQLEATPGEQVGPDRDKPVATVADLDQVLVLGDLSQRDAAALSTGMTAWVSVPGVTAAPIKGTVETVSEVVDPERQTIPVRVRASNESRQLRPNSFVDLRFEPANGADVVQIPAQAVVSDGTASVVFVETSPGVFRRRGVTVGRQDRSTAEIASGLKAGERVVVNGALLLLNALDVEG